MDCGSLATAFERQNHRGGQQTAKVSEPFRYFDDFFEVESTSTVSVNEI
jgi:hypothetical protein